MLKGTLQYKRLKHKLNTIDIYQSASNRASFERKCLNSIKKIYQHAGKCDQQQNLKMFLRLLWFLLHNEKLMTVLV